MNRADLGLLCEALLVVVGVRLSLWWVPSPAVLRFVGRRVERGRILNEPTPRVRRVGWAVRQASRRVPRASCLTQALSTQLLLARRGYSSRLRIGVARDAADGFVAHAWVDVGGKTLVGGGNLGLYHEMPDLHARL